MPCCSSLETKLSWAWWLATSVRSSAHLAQNRAVFPRCSSMTPPKGHFGFLHGLWAMATSPAPKSVGPVRPTHYGRAFAIAKRVVAAIRAPFTKKEGPSQKCVTLRGGDDSPDREAACLSLRHNSLIVAYATCRSSRAVSFRGFKR
jgi:hypothetical protein